jgi:hypothetical protein
MSLAAIGALAALPAAAEPIRHDAEHYVLLHQYAEQWVAEDEGIEQKPLNIDQLAAEGVTRCSTRAATTPTAGTATEYQACIHLMEDV